MGNSVLSYRTGGSTYVLASLLAQGLKMYYILIFIGAIFVIHRALKPLHELEADIYRKIDEK